MLKYKVRFKTFSEKRKENDFRRKCCIKGALLKTYITFIFYKWNKINDSAAFSISQSIKPYYLVFKFVKNKIMGINWKNTFFFLFEKFHIYILVFAGKT